MDRYVAGQRTVFKIFFRDLIGLKKDRIMTFVLVALIASSIYMTIRMWFVEKLWPEGYNFFASWEKIAEDLPIPKFLRGNSDASAPMHEDMFLPRKIMINRSGSSRSMYRSGDREFVALNQFTKDILSQLFKKDGVRYIVVEKETDFYDTLKSKSILLDYPVQMPTRLLGQLYEAAESSIYSQVTSVKEIVIVPGDSVTNETIVMMKDSKTNIIYKYFIPFSKTDLEQEIEKYSKGNAANMFSAYELGFYRRSTAAELQPQVVIDPFVFLDTTNEEIRVPALSGFNPFTLGRLESMDSNIVSRILKVFDYNPNTISKHIDDSYTMVFVENYSTLKLHTNGLLEYSTIDSKKGIKLRKKTDGADNMQSFLESMDTIAEMITQIWRALDMPDMPDMRISSDITDKKYGSYQLYIDYLYDGMPVLVEIAGEDGIEQMRHAIEITVENNVLQSFRIFLRSYEKNEEITANMPLIHALDNLYNASSEPYVATDIFMGYVENGTGEPVRSCWNIQLKDGSTVAIASN